MILSKSLHVIRQDGDSYDGFNTYNWPEDNSKPPPINPVWKQVGIGLSVVTAVLMITVVIVCSKLWGRPKINAVAGKNGSVHNDYQMQPLCGGRDGVEEGQWDNRDDATLCETRSAGPTRPAEVV